MCCTGTTTSLNDHLNTPNEYRELKSSQITRTSAVLSKKALANMPRTALKMLPTKSQVYQSPRVPYCETRLPFTTRERRSTAQCTSHRFPIHFESIDVCMSLNLSPPALGRLQVWSSLDPVTTLKLFKQPVTERTDGVNDSHGSPVQRNCERQISTPAE